MVSQKFLDERGVVLPKYLNVGVFVCMSALIQYLFVFEADALHYVIYNFVYRFTDIDSKFMLDFLKRRVYGEGKNNEDGSESQDKDQMHMVVGVMYIDRVL